MALALRDYESDIADCGHPRSLAMHPESTDQWTAEAYRCHACTAVAAKQESMKEARHPQALRFAPDLRPEIAERIKRD